jgi:hypothetical protein
LDELNDITQIRQEIARLAITHPRDPAKRSLLY